MAVAKRRSLFGLQTSSADDRFADHDDEVEDSPLSGYSANGLKSDVSTPWGSVCSLFESASASYAVLNDILRQRESFDLLLSSDEIEEINIVATQYRVGGCDY